MYVVPTLALYASKSRSYFTRQLLQPGNFSSAIIFYAFPIYVSGLIFVAIPYLPQLIIDDRLNDVAVGTYGLVLIFTAPVSLVVYSLRAVVLPKMLSSYSTVEQFLWSRRGLFLIFSVIVLVGLSGQLVAYILSLVYGHRFPEIRKIFSLFFLCHAITAGIGFYSLSVHTRSCLLYTSPSPRDLSTSRMPSSA